FPKDLALNRDGIQVYIEDFSDESEATSTATEQSIEHYGDASKNTCFGGTLGRFLLSRFFGYDDIMMSSIRSFADDEEGKGSDERFGCGCLLLMVRLVCLGYVRNLVTGRHYRFVVMWMTGVYYLLGFSVMIVFTFLISTLVRFFYNQVFLCMLQLSQMFVMNRVIMIPVAPLLTAVLALIGMRAILVEFFNDSSTAVFVMALVWLADQYDSLCCRSSISKRFWPRFFFLYHFTFYAYYYRFNGHYSGLALLTSWLFIQVGVSCFFLIRTEITKSFNVIEMMHNPCVVTFVFIHMLLSYCIEEAVGCLSSIPLRSNK
ncbi:unnamed protein product, partial [Soboliphyme baturini]|uniref:Acyl_transf_3 domain-containing protein n=1 Tax=Soboliphyme baturini TaxID=241478 RepID=A0A183IVT1_9BILA